MHCERPKHDGPSLPMLRLGGRLFVYDATVSRPPAHLGFEKTDERNIRPWDEVWLVRAGLGHRGTVVEVRHEQVRVVVGGMVCRVPREDVVGVLPRQHSRETGSRGKVECLWTAAGWMSAAD